MKTWITIAVLIGVGLAAAGWVPLALSNAQDVQREEKAKADKAAAEKKAADDKAAAEKADIEKAAAAKAIAEARAAGMESLKGKITVAYTNSEMSSFAIRDAEFKAVAGRLCLTGPSAKILGQGEWFTGTPMIIPWDAVTAVMVMTDEKYEKFLESDDGDIHAKRL